MNLQLTSEAMDFSVCSSMVEEYCQRLGLPQKSIFKITLVLDELITNIISYGYDDPDSYLIDVQLFCKDDGLVLVLSDNARPFNPLLDAAKPELDLPLEQRARPIGGMGVHLVKSLMDSVHYERVDDRNVLTLKKSLDECSLGQEKT